MNYLLFLIPIGLFIFLAWTRRGHGGSIGQAIRNSDHWAWSRAVEEKKRELDDLKRMEPKL